MSDHAAPRNATLADELGAETGVHVADCYQCGKCSAGCPMAAEMPLKTHQIVRLLQLDRRERLLADESMWLCLTCETCTARCPNGVDPAQLIDALRERAMRDGADNAPLRIRAFHRAFLDQIRAHGRVFEFPLVASYKVRSGRLFDDVTSAPGMVLRGKLELTPSNIQGVAEVRRIFEACDAAREEA